MTSAAAKPSLEQATVLVVEDEAPQLDVLRYNLEREGFTVVATDDGEEALLLAVETMPDAIVLDWMLPSVSGIEVCRRLKQSEETLPHSPATPLYQPSNALF